jgi:hypothetical protein
VKVILIEAPNEQGGGSAGVDRKRTKANTSLLKDNHAAIFEGLLDVGEIRQKKRGLLLWASFSATSE